MVKPLIEFQVFTLFPEIFPGPLSCSIAGKAREKGLWNLHVTNIRDYAQDKHSQVDDAPYGGGTGMVLRPDVLGKALDQHTGDNTVLLYPSPRGKLFTQKDAKTLVKKEKIAIVCGRFEGLDERVIEAYNIQEVSVGDYILSGGEIAALAIMDSCLRLVPGVIGNEAAVKEESFGLDEDYSGLLEYPLYTRPLIWKERKVPETLLSGNHKEIAQWRLKKAQEITQKRRPDLWEHYKKNKEEGHE